MLLGGVDPGEDREKPGHEAERPHHQDGEDDPGGGDALVVEQGPVDDGEVPVQGDAAQVEDGRRAQGHVHRVVGLTRRPCSFRTSIW